MSDTPGTSEERIRAAMPSVRPTPGRPCGNVVVQRRHLPPVETTPLTVSITPKANVTTAMPSVAA